MSNVFTILFPKIQKERIRRFIMSDRDFLFPFVVFILIVIIGMVGNIIAYNDFKNDLGILLAIAAGFSSLSIKRKN